MSPFEFVWTINVADLLMVVLIAVTLLAAIATILYSRRAQRRAHTFDVLLARFSGDYVAGLHEFAEPYLRKKKKLPPGNVRHPKIIELLNLYEFISFAGRTKILDHKVICEMRSGTIARIYENFSDYIVDIRIKRKSPLAFEHLEWFVNKRVKPFRARKGISGNEE